MKFQFLKMVAVSLCLGMIFSSSAFAAKTIKIRSADTVALDSPYTIAMNEVFIPLLKEKSGGTIEVTHYPAGQLGSDGAIAEGVKLGTIDMAIIGTLHSSAADCMYLPFLFKSIEHQEKFLKSDVADTIKKRILDDSGLKVVGFAYFASRQLTANRKIENAADLKGLKIRVPTISPMIATWKALGASPTPIAFGELFTALQQDIVDAQENPFEIILNNSFYEVQDYIMVTNHSIPVRFCTINNDFWQSLTLKQQQAFNEAWQETALEIKRLYVENDVRYVKELKEKGMQFVTVDREFMIEASKDVWKDFAPEAWGPGVYEKIQEMDN